MYKISKLFLFLLILVFSLSSVPVSAQFPVQQLTPPPVQYPRSHNYDVQHYRIEVSFDWREKSVSGETTITFTPFTDGVKEVEIDAGNMSIKSVRLAQGAPLTFRYVDNEKLYVTLDKNYSPGAPVAVAIAYKAVPRDGQGMTFITPTETDKTRPYQIWTQG